MAVSEVDKEAVECTPEDDRSTPKQPRVRRMKACKQCHSLKVRCTPVDENDPYSPCIRCMNTNKVCEIDLDQPRKRRKKTNNRESELIAELQVQIADLQEQLRLLRNEKEKEGVTSSKMDSLELSYSTSVAAEGGSPPFISKVDLEREMSYLCEEDISLSEILEDIQKCADRRKELLVKNQVIDVVSLGVISLDEANHRLEVYRDKLYAAHPFIELPQNMSVEQFIQEKPYLFNSIMAISSMVLETTYDRDTNLALENHAIEKIVGAVMVAGTKNVELLKSLILLSFWYNSPELFKLRRYHILNCVAVTLLHDLGIMNRSSYTYSSDTKAIQKNEDDYKGLEYRSLILILYFSTVSICLVLRRAIFVKWTPYVNECCDLLEKMGDEKYKKLAVFLRLNHELERIHHIVHAPEVYENKPNKLSKYALAEFQTNLAIIRSNLKPSDHQHRAYYYSVEAYLHQPILNDIHLNVSSPNGCAVQKLESETLSAIAHCTASCLFALDEFNQLLVSEIAGLPLIYCSRVIYTAGMLMRLRYLILSLPSHIEKELVPRYAIVAILKLNKLVGIASKRFPGNYFLKKMRLILLLFIQTYVTQVMELLKKNDDSTPSNFKPAQLSRTTRNDLVKVSSTLFKQGDTGNMITENGLSYPPALHLDLLSFAASAFRNNTDERDQETNGELKAEDNANQGVPREQSDFKIPGLAAFNDSRRLLAVRTINNMAASQTNMGSEARGLSMGGNITHNATSLKLYTFPNPPMIHNPNLTSGGTPVNGDGFQSLAPVQSNFNGGASPIPEMELVNGKDNPFLSIDDEFWSNLLSTDSNKFHFAQNEPVLPDSFLFMN